MRTTIIAVSLAAAFTLVGTATGARTSSAARWPAAWESSFTVGCMAPFRSELAVGQANVAYAQSQVARWSAATASAQASGDTNAYIEAKEHLSIAKQNLNQLRDQLPSLSDAWATCFCALRSLESRFSVRDVAHIEKLSMTKWRQIVGRAVLACS